VSCLNRKSGELGEKPRVQNLKSPAPSEPFLQDGLSNEVLAAMAEADLFSSPSDSGALTWLDIEIHGDHVIS